MGCGACGDAFKCDEKSARCDSCWMWFHLKCAGIKSLPTSDWLCKKCKERKGSKGEELDVLKQLLENQSKMLDNLMKEKEKTAGFYKRQCLQKLPIFSGALGEWPRFKAIFDKTTEEGGYDDMENCNRLLECLRKPARDLVEVKLTNPENLNDVLKYLEQVYGNPRRIYDQLMNDVISVRPPREGNKESYLEFGTKLSNLVCNLEMLKMRDRLKDPRLIGDLLKKMSLGQQEKWFEYANGKDENDLSVFNDFIQARISILMNLHYNNDTRAIPTKGNLHLQAAGEDQLSSNIIDQPQQCLVCKESTKHHLSECSVFNDMSVNDRWEQVKAMKLCFGCLNRVKHQLNQCQGAQICGVNDCKRKHHSLLHQTNRNTTELMPAASSSFVGTHQNNESEEQPLFMILPVTVSANNVKIDTFAFLDSGSSFTLMETEIAQQLGLTGTPEKFGMVTTKGRLAIEENSLRTTCHISGRNSNKQYKLRDIRTGSDWGFPVGTLEPDVLTTKFPHLRGLPLPQYFNAVPKILIGTNNQSLLSYNCIVEKSDTDPIAVKTKLGWCVFGKSHIDGIDSGYIFQINQLRSGSQMEIDGENFQNDNDEEDLHKLVRSFFTTENFGCMPRLNDKKIIEDKRVNQIVNDTLKKIDGRYEVGLLWKKDTDQLPDSYKMALKRLTYVEARIKRDPELANWYSEEINAYLRKGYCRKLSKEEINAPWPRIWYIPFFHVINPNKVPRKIRLVFDAAAKVGKISLNSKLLTGPNVYASMPGVIFKFREGKYCVAADIREMFPQVKVKEVDQHAQRFLWRGGDTTREPDTYIMTSMIFGASCSPFLAQLVKNKNAMQFVNEFPEAVDAIHNQHFVDDYLDSHDTIDHAITIAKQVIHIHREAGFELRNFVSNSREILSALPQSTNIVKEVAMNWETENVTEKILGVFWNISNDVFEIKVNHSRIPDDVLTLKRSPTKREILRIVMSFFDPIGMVSHALIRAKLLLQETWRANLDWDHSLTEKLFAKWASWFRSFLQLSGFTIPRVYTSTIHTVSEIQMHTFVDASEYAFSTAIYFRFTFADRVECRLVTSKARVAPNKVLTVPRLELQAAVLGSRLADFVRHQHRLKINKQYFWSDSKTVLSWILCSDLQSLKPFVGVRISEIQDLSQPNEWRKVPTKLNVADDATKWTDTTLFHINDRWFNAPEFLYQPENEWPDYDYQKLPTPLETRAPVFTLKPLEVSFTAVPIDRFSSYTKLVRVVALMLRFLKNCRNNDRFNIDQKQQRLLQVKTAKCTVEIPAIDSQEHQSAELMIIRAIQFQAFSEEYVALTNGADLHKKSRLFPLTPVMDSNKIIRLNSRIKKSPNITYSQMMPAILPNKHPVVDLIVAHHHQKFLHQFQEAVIASIRKKFWIMSVRQAVRRIKSNCQQCKNKRAQPLPTIMGELPLCRLQSGGKPFQHTGMDFFGPLHATMFRKCVKCYVFLFTCMVTRGIHVELVLSLSADDCIMNIRNFLNRRGPTQHFYCDNGTNFHGAHRELLRELEKMSPQLATSNDDYILTWHFNPPGASHFGGAFERLNLSVGRALDVVFSHQKPKLETLRTALIECENIINSRPLTHIPLESEDESPITPNNFLKLHVNQLPAPGEFSAQELCLRKQWRIAQFIANEFWRKWRTYYLPELARRSKWFKRTPDIAVGDIVLLVDNSAPRNEWRKGRVVELIPGTDRVVRVVAVSCNNKIYTRPILKLAKLDIQPKIK